MISTIDRLLELERKAYPSPWEWSDSEEKDRADIVYYEPYTEDGKKKKGIRFDVITRDSGAYGPDVPTGDFLCELRNNIRPLLLRMKKLEEISAVARSLRCDEHFWGDYADVEGHARLAHLYYELDNLDETGKK